ncbi:Agamous-like MADS-box protein AGL80 [Linum grandiflorum]
MSTLCDVKACAIIYSPYHTQPEIWPPTFAGVHEVSDIRYNIFILVIFL